MPELIKIDEFTKSVIKADPSVTNEDFTRLVSSRKDIRLIRPNAFAGCNKLTNITIPEGVTSIGESAFSNCKNLANVLLPFTIKSIGPGAFTNTALSLLFIPPYIEVLSNSCLMGTHLERLDIPEGLFVRDLVDDKSIIKEYNKDTMFDAILETTGSIKALNDASKSMQENLTGRKPSWGGR